MNVIKSIFGSVFGAAIGVGIYYAIKQFTGETYIWFPIIIGILTGIMARVLAGKATSNSGRYVAGAMSGLIAGSAIFGVDIVPSLLADQQTEFPAYRTEESTDSAARSDAPDASDDEPSDVEGDNNGDTADESESSDGNDADTPSDANDGDGDSADGEADEADGTDQGEDSDPSSDATETDQADATADANDTDELRGPQAEAFRERGKASRRTSPEDAAAANERFAELIGKPAHDSWFSLYLPYIFSGIGVLLAYQLAKGFGSAEPKK